MQAARNSYQLQQARSSYLYNPNRLNISNNMKDCFTVPNFKIFKKKNNKTNTYLPRASVVGDLISNLEKKEEEKKKIEEENLLIKQEREKKKTEREKEQEINKNLQERKKIFTQQIKDIKLKINDKSKNLRSKVTAENKDEIKEEINKLRNQ